MTILPQMKYSILPLTVLMLAAPQMTLAQSSSSLAGLYGCEQLVGDTAQLACYKSETAKIRALETAQGTMPATGERLAIDQERERLSAERESLAAERARIAAEKKNLAKAKKPAFNRNFEKDPNAPKSQAVAITKAETLKVSGYIRFTLANGEVWQQTEPERVRLGRAAPDVLVITKGRIGGYFGKVNDRRPSFKVKRVK